MLNKYRSFSWVLLMLISSVSIAEVHQDPEAESVATEQAALEALLAKHKEDKKKDSYVWTPGILGLLASANGATNYYQYNVSDDQFNRSWEGSYYDNLRNRRAEYKKAKSFLQKVGKFKEEMLISSALLGLAGYNYYQNKKKEQKRSVEVEEAKKKLQEAKKKLERAKEKSKA